MRAYKVKVVLKSISPFKKGSVEKEIREEVMILSDSDIPIEEWLQMCYGCHYDIISEDIEEINAYVSPNYIKKKSSEILGFSSFDEMRNELDNFSSLKDILT